MAISNCMIEQSTELKRAKKKMGELKFELNKARLALADVYQLMADLVIVEQARDANYVAATQAQDKATLAQLQEVAYGPHL